MADDVNELARRFEPALIFHHSERFYPSNAKNYIEHCALWSSERPLDQKDSWGGKGKPFNRKPAIARGTIAASDAAGEIGTRDTYLGTRKGTAFPFLAENGEQHFLELAGWKDSADVTATSENRYANRDQVADRYASVQALSDSEHWYHVELFDTVRLRTLLIPQEPTGAQLDLSSAFAQLAPQNPALLCYYFFFPAHDESLPEPCDLKEAGKEFAGFAGEWACVAILLGRESASKPYEPTHIGRTGRINVGSKQGLDRERRFGMTVTKWRERTDVHTPPLPETIGHHPLLYVSLGVHSLHLEAGPHRVDPYLPEVAPIGCGQFDSPVLLTDYQNSLPPQEEEGSPAAAWGKVVAGLFLGGLPGLIGGAIATALEGLPLIETGFSGKATGSAPPEKPAVDEGTEPVNFGRVLCSDDLLEHPAFAGTFFVRPWLVGQTEIAGRHYDFIVDRSKQIWWPGDDGRSGYRGRWGPLVVDDPYHRRSGMFFPEFWKMFFMGLVKSQ